jgi:hypothetical protein
MSACSFISNVKNIDTPNYTLLIDYYTGYLTIDNEDLEQTILTVCANVPLAIAGRNILSVDVAT